MLFSNLKFAFKTRKAWWYTATSRSRARFAKTTLGSFWLGLSNLLSIGTLGIVYGTVFSVDNFSSYFIYLGFGLVIWNTIASAIASAPNLFEHNQVHVHNTSINPVFYTLEEWAFQIQTFIQSFLLVVLALSTFQKTLLFNMFLPHFVHKSPIK